MNKKTHPIKINPSKFLLGAVFTIGTIAVCLTLSEIILKNVYVENGSSSYKVVRTNSNKNTYNKFESDLSIVNPSDNWSEDYFVVDQITLNELELDDIKKISDDEMLAYKTYKYICDKYDINIFNNITESELTHYNAVSYIISKSNLTDEKYNEMFYLEESQVLYDELTKKADMSVTEALKVALKIEELDIKDIEMVKANSSNPELLSLYNNLQKASRNHLRSFNKVLSRYGETYTPEHLSQDEFNAIILAPMELKRL